MTRSINNIDSLQDSETLAQYLSAALETGSMDEFLTALQSVWRTNGNSGALSEITALHRQNLYKLLAVEGGPTLSRLLAALQAVGLTLTIKPIEPSDSVD